MYTESENPQGENFGSNKTEDRNEEMQKPLTRYDMVAVALVQDHGGVNRAKVSASSKSSIRCRL